MPTTTGMPKTQSLLNLFHPKELPTETKVFSSASLSKTMQRDTRTQEVATHLLIASPKLSSPRFQGNGSLVGSAHSTFSRVTFSNDRNSDRPLTQHLEILPGLEVRKHFCHTYVPLRMRVFRRRRKNRLYQFANEMKMLLNWRSQFWLISKCLMQFLIHFRERNLLTQL